jgi:voltage-gated potassium channel
MAVLHELYHGETVRAHRFRYGLLAFDIAAVLFVIASSFMMRSIWIEALDMVIAALMLGDFAARLSLERRRAKFLSRPGTWLDLVVIVSFAAPLAGEGLGFLRVLRTLRLLRTYHLLAQLRRDWRLFRQHEEVVVAAINLAVFLFVMTGLIYETQHRSNPDIRNYADALYFTVATLTTTGFGDITLQGTGGRLLSVAVMIFGVTLFLRLAQVMFRPSKVRHPCATCGLALHDADAVHCKHCGATVKIETEGDS